MELIYTGFCHVGGIISVAIQLFERDKRVLVVVDGAEELENQPWSTIATALNRVVDRVLENQGRDYITSECHIFRKTGSAYFLVGLQYDKRKWIGESLDSLDHASIDWEDFALNDDTIQARRKSKHHGYYWGGIK